MIYAKGKLAGRKKAEEKKVRQRDQIEVKFVLSI